MQCRKCKAEWQSRGLNLRSFQLDHYLPIFAKMRNCLMLKLSSNFHTIIFVFFTQELCNGKSYNEFSEVFEGIYILFIITATMSTWIHAFVWYTIGPCTVSEQPYLNLRPICNNLGSLVHSLEMSPSLVSSSDTTCLPTGFCSVDN